MGNRLVYLKRLRMGPLALDFPLGSVRPLRQEEEEALYGLGLR